jgi:phenylpropionate dioxygenase-like ring-hydroxylating dioxygenase large terminal subunit
MSMTREDNDLLTRVGPGTPMGDLFRQYPIPVLPSTDLPAGGPPKRVRLLGEDLIAFRTRRGTVSVMGEACQHKLASLYYGRIEDDGMRCVYHGWKFGFDGRCLDMPNVPPECQFRERIRHPAYPCVEKAGVVWTYMGGGTECPALPELEFLAVPEGHRAYRVDYQNCNYMQALEGGIDPAHGAFLHGPIHSLSLADASALQPHGTGLAGDRAIGRTFTIAFATGQRTPRVETAETDYGIMTAGRRDGPGDEYLWRVNHFLMPFYTMPPADGIESYLAHMWVPVDDHHHINWLVMWNPHRPLNEEEISSHNSAHLPPTPEAFGHIRLSAQRSNDYFMDWEIHATRRFGIPTIHLEDVAVTESQGPIVDRTREHLTQADEPVAAARRMLVNSARSLRDKGVIPPGAKTPAMYRAIRGASLTLSKAVAWTDTMQQQRRSALNLDQREGRG